MIQIVKIYEIIVHRKCTVVGLFTCIVFYFTDYCWRLSLVPGLKYFTFVEACNGAGLCSQSISDGIIVDNSPPLAGLVYIQGVTGRMVYLNDR